MRSLTTLLVAALCLGTVAATPAVTDDVRPADVGTAGAHQDLDRLDPVRYSYEDAIVEWVQVGSRNGKDRIWVDLIRPDTGDTGEPVPTILIASPYYNTLGRGWRGELKTPHQGPEVPTSPGVPLLAGGEAAPFPEWYDEYFVERGYAVALMDLRGTRNTTGCQVYGDRDEVYDVVDTVDWIADQPWSNGKVGMTGGSYDGTVAIGAAVEQPMTGRHRDALAAIIPIRAIGRWYDYHFMNGVQSFGHTLTPALFTAALAGADTQNSGTDDPLTPLWIAERKACIPTAGAIVDAGYASPFQDTRDEFWTERDFVKNLPGSRAATFVIHGLFDYNVKTNNAGHLWESLPEQLPKKLWLMNGDHVDPHVPTPEDAAAGSHVMPFPFQERFVEATHRWYLEFLKGVDAGATDGPDVEIQRRDGSWDADDTFPAAGDDLVLYPTADGALSTDGPEEGTLSWQDAAIGATSATLVSEPLPRDTRISGQLGFDLTLTTEGPDTTVAAQVLALPPGRGPGDSSTDVWTTETDRPLRTSYAWARAWYRDSIPLRGLSSPVAGGPVEGGEPFELAFGSLYTDLVIPEGWRLSVRFSNAATTVPAATGGTVSLDLA
ncbi:MAG: CocE/NonD family hydrolase, partial [Actinobacteria bacterium]|nr:CocE/NonD family hydrolase [Actinomycetota bacterium]